VLHLVETQKVWDYPFGGKKYIFDNKLFHGNGKLYAADIIPIRQQDPMKYVSPEAAKLAMDFEKFHCII
jgi:hypothetical protein